MRFTPQSDVRASVVGAAVACGVFAGLGLLAAGSASAAPILFGSDADTYLRDSTARGSFEFMDIRGGDVDFRGYLRFDLSSLAEPILSASLTLTISGGASRNDAVIDERFALYGLTNAAGNTPQNWDEATFVLSMKGAEDVTTLAGVVDLDGDVAGIGEDINPGSALGTTITISGSPLVAFLESRIGDGGLATFILSNDDPVDRGFGLASKENAIVAYRPILSVNISETAPVSESSALWMFGVGAALALARRRGAYKSSERTSGP